MSVARYWWKRVLVLVLGCLGALLCIGVCKCILVYVAFRCWMLIHVDVCYCVLFCVDRC